MFFRLLILFFKFILKRIHIKAIVGLNGMQLGENRLLVQLAATGARQPLIVQPGGIGTQVVGIDLSRGAGPPTEVLCLMNMVTEEELQQDEEYEGK